MRQYKIATRFVFDGYFTINAETVSEARKRICDSCGLVLGEGIHKTLPDEEINWEFPVHPIMTIHSIKNNASQKNRGEKKHGNFS